MCEMPFAKKTIIQYSKLQMIFILYVQRGMEIMLNWVLLFFVIAIVAAVLGFTTIAAQAAGIAKILFFIFLVLFVVSLLAHLFRSK
jgi:uncharacterized membrane protein YtjA (UPF0391 family)